MNALPASPRNAGGAVLLVGGLLLVPLLALVATAIQTFDAEALAHLARTVLAETVVVRPSSRPARWPAPCCSASVAPGASNATTSRAATRSPGCWCCRWRCPPTSSPTPTPTCCSTAGRCSTGCALSLGYGGRLPDVQVARRRGGAVLLRVLPVHLSDDPHRAGGVVEFRDRVGAAAGSVALGRLPAGGASADHALDRRRRDAGADGDARRCRRDPLLRPEHLLGRHLQDLVRHGQPQRRADAGGGAARRRGRDLRDRAQGPRARDAGDLAHPPALGAGARSTPAPGQRRCRGVVPAGAGRLRGSGRRRCCGCWRANRR